MRNRGLEEYKAYINSFNPIPQEDNLPKLQIFNSCKVLIEAIKACSYDKPKNNKPAEDIAEFEGDDPIDGLRYLVDTAEAYFTDAQSEFNQVQRREEYVRLMQNTGDWTAFYRNMGQLDKVQSNLPKPVRLLHSRRIH
jgi:hypothetical protein